MNVNTINNASNVSEVTPFVPSQTNNNTVQESQKIAESQAQKKSAKASKVEETKQMVETLNEMMSDLETNLGFQIREDMHNQVIVEVKNRKTDELIRQIPSEDLLKIMEKMEDLSGLIFDGQV